MISSRFIRRFAPISICAFLALSPSTLLAQADRISGPVDATRLLPVPGNVNPRATAAADEGPVDPATKLNYIELVLKPSAAQQTELNNLLSEQQNPRSPYFRKWLTPEQYADRFGVSPADIAKITQWMQSQGFDIITVARGRRYIAFNATAQQIQSALKTEIHHYRVDGELHFANASAPQVPAAIQPLVLSFTGLDDFLPKPASHGRAIKSRFTSSSGANLVTPGDLAIIYDLVPVYQAGVTGSGQYIAVIGQSDVQLSDIASFRATFGLSSNPPQPVLVPGSTNPGLVSGDEGESDLDLEYAGGMAPDATVLFVYSTAVYKSVSYAIDQALAPVISFSYAGCELNSSSSAAQTLQTLAQQANTEGITWLVAAGDDGAAMCDTTAATHGLSVSLEAALPEATGVGGTMFTGGSGYWSSQNSSNGSSALRYIPETVWNESTDTELSAGGGGLSIYFDRPAWQVNPSITSSKITARGVPDVSLTAAHNDDPYAVVELGKADEVGGTSAATPVFAGIILLLNQYLGTNGVGNINPSLYFMAENTPRDFHDITTGNNAVPCVVGSTDCSTGAFGYKAVAGWDPASGLGSIDATNMFNDWSVGAGNPQIVSVLNGASFTNTGLSPGQFFTIFGSNLGPANGQGLELDQNGNVSTYLAGISVKVNGTYAPLLYVSPTQINAIAPYEIGTTGYATVEVYDNEVSSGGFNAALVAAAPAIFPLGNGQGAILNQNYSVNGPSAPAARGSYISIYGTGQGQTNPAGVDGQINGTANLPAPVGSVAVTIGGVAVPKSDILFAADAPYEVDGFFQVDVKIPSNVSSGNQPVVLSIGGIAGPPANVAIQ